MSVSARSYVSASLAVLTAGVLAVAPVNPDVATPRNHTTYVTLAASQDPFDLNPQGSGDLSNINLLKSGYHLGIDTIGQTLKNANLQIRSEPPNPQLNTGPWNQSAAVGVDAAAVAVTFSASLITYIRAGNVGQNNLYNSFAAVASAPSVTAAVARLNTDWAQLITGLTMQFNHSGKWVVYAPVLAAVLNALIKIDTQLGYSQNSLTDVVDNTIAPPEPEAKSPLVESWAQLKESWVLLKESWAPATPVAEAPAAVVVDRQGRLRGGVVRPSLPVASLASRARAASLAPVVAATLVAEARAAVVADEPAAAQAPAGDSAETSVSTPATKPVNKRTARKAAASRG